MAYTRDPSIHAYPRGWDHERDQPRAPHDAGRAFTQGATLTVGGVPYHEPQTACAPEKAPMTRLEALDHNLADLYGMAEQVLKRVHAFNHRTVGYSSKLSSDKVAGLNTAGAEMALMTRIESRVNALRQAVLEIRDTLDSNDL